MDWDVCAHGYGLAEAPTIDIDGSLVFSDVLGGGVYRIDTSGTVNTPLLSRIVSACQVVGPFAPSHKILA